MRIHVIDFEGSLKGGVVEYGVVTLDGCEILEVQTGLCRPDEPMDARDILIHGLREEALANQPRFSTFQQQFYRFRMDGLMAAHQASVENGFLMRYWNTVPAQAGKGNVYPSCGLWGPWVDSKVVYRRYYDLADYSLMALVDVFQLRGALDELGNRYCPEGRVKAHCALYDSLASALLLIAAQRNLGLDAFGLVRASQSLSAEDVAQRELF